MDLLNHLTRIILPKRERTVHRDHNHIDPPQSIEVGWFQQMMQMPQMRDAQPRGFEDEDRVAVDLRITAFVSAKGLILSSRKVAGYGLVSSSCGGKGARWRSGV
jgi:hypothetical protein